MIAVAVPLAVPALASDNEAKIGGRIFTSIEHERNGKGQSATDISDNNSRIWIMGSEKLDKDRFRRDLGNIEEAYKEMLFRLTGERA